MNKEDYCELWDVDDGSTIDWAEDEASEDESPTSASSSNIQILYYCRLLAIFLLSWQSKFNLSDSAIRALLQFIVILLSLLNKVIGSQLLSALTVALPKSCIQCRSILKISDKTFKKYVSCVKCCSIYSMEECVEKDLRGKQVSKRCPYIRFPTHPQTQYRQICGSLLLKEVKYGHKNFCYPFRTFCWKSIIDTLHGLLSRPGFLQNCEHWRTRYTQSSFLLDIYDGRIWTDFQVVKGREFLKQPNNFGLMMNIDWFQPFKRTTYSVGVIYIVIMNLPREERFLPKNVIICGVIPGPAEPKKDINSYLTPLVSDLQRLWNGVFMELPTSRLPVLVRAALLCIAADIPATRKTCGFTGHNSTMGCSKCLKQFDIKVGESSDYSGYDRHNWPKRTDEHHRHHSSLYRNARTKSAQNYIAKSTGVRFTILHELEYFNCVRFHVVDPMHNLLLGTAKHIMSVWIKQEIIRPFQYDQLQASVDCFTFPSDIGRIPYKIASGFSGFTADQWRIWTVILSPIALKSILPPVHYRCWSLFVEACYLLCSRSLSYRSAEKADDLLLEFCTTFQSLYGSECCTANMHMHCHLKECTYDYGPVYSFWLFSFERFNGLLGSIQSNKRSIEPQLMKRFICDQQLHSESLTTELRESNTLEILSNYHVVKGSVAQQITHTTGNCSSCPSSSFVATTASYSILGPTVEDALNSDMYDCLRGVYANKEPENFVKCLRSYLKVGAVLHKGRIFGSTMSRRVNASNILAKHPSLEYRAAQVQHFCLHKVILKENTGEKVVQKMCALVSWYDLHPEREWFCKPANIYCKYFHSDGFVFLSDIACRLATSVKSVKFQYGFESVLCVVPLESQQI